MQTGDVIGGRWRLGQRLGQGAFGQVFQADDQSTLSLGAAAVKVMHPSTSPAERSAFHDEIRKVVALRHPNLVAYLDSGEYLDEGGSAHLYLVTELCQYSLSDYLASQPTGTLTAEQTERLLADMAAGLGYLHSRGLLHRDLKPANVLLGGTDWKLGDFGLTRELSATGHYHHGNVLMGTPRYMSPELFENGPASPAADVYAVGVTLHQALTGRLVHEANTDIALIVQVTTTPPTIDPGLPPHWRRLIERCLDRDPARRPGASQLPAVLAESRYQVPAPIQPVVDPPAGAGHPGATQPGAAETGSVAPFQAAGGSGQSRALLLGALGAAALVALVVVALVVRSLTGGDDTAGGTTRTAATGDGTASSAPAGSTTTPAPTAPTTLPPPVDTRPPEERIAAIVPAPADAPAEFSYTEAPPLAAELCAGVAPLLAAHPGLAIDGIEYLGSVAQIILARGGVHASVAAAEEAFDYADALDDRCNGQPLDTGGSEVWKMTPDPTVTVAGADESVAVIYETIGGAPSTGILTVHARVGDVTVQVSGSDRAATLYYVALMVARARLQPDPPKVEPTGDVGNIVTGNPGKVRLLLASQGEGLRPGLKAWADSHPNEDIDTAVNGICDALAAAQTPNEIGAGLVAAYEALPADVKGDMDSEDYAQLAGAGPIFYCPDEMERLGLS